MRKYVRSIPHRHIAPAAAAATPKPGQVAGRSRRAHERKGPESGHWRIHSAGSRVSTAPAICSPCGGSDLSGAFRYHDTLPGVSKAIPSVPAWTAADLRRLVSADRFEPYLTDAAGSPEAAASLYAWSGRVAGAVYEELGMAEIVLRNVLDCQLCLFHRRRLRGNGQWWAEPQMPWALGRRRDQRLADQVSVARRQATDGGLHPVVPGKVVAELHFGFWRYLLASKYYTALWVPALNAAFPHLPVRDRKSASANRMVFDVLGNLNRARNRVAHHEPVAASACACHNDILKVAGWIDPKARAWINDTGRITAVLATRPC
jgi:hypothetical protein